MFGLSHYGVESFSKFHCGSRNTNLYSLYIIYPVCTDECLKLTPYNRLKWYENDCRMFSVDCDTRRSKAENAATVTAVNSVSVVVYTIHSQSPVPYHELSCMFDFLRYVFSCLGAFTVVVKPSFHVNHENGT